MNKRIFQYPKTIQVSKVYSKTMIVIGALLLPLILVANKPSDFNSLLEYGLAISSVPLILILGSTLYIGYFSNLEISEEGLEVEFLWKRLKIPWDGIIKVKHVGFKQFGSTIILVDKHYLTPIHRIYSLLALGAFLPSFYIHTEFKGFKDSIDIIEKKKAIQK